MCSVLLLGRVRDGGMLSLCEIKPVIIICSCCFLLPHDIEVLFDFGYLVLIFTVYFLISVAGNTHHLTLLALL